MKDLRDHYPLEELQKYQEDIFRHILAMDIYQEAMHIALYYPIHQEVDTRILIHDALKHHKHVYLPKIKDGEMAFYELFEEDDLQEGVFHIFEPRSSKKVDPDIFNLMFVPLLAFNERYYRMGYGKGFYDRYLKNKNIYTIGLAYHFQKCSFQEEDHDVPLKKMITDSYANT